MPYMKGSTPVARSLAAGLAAAQLIGNVRGLSSDGIRSEGFNVLKKGIGNIGGVDVSGVANTIFPKG